MYIICEVLFLLFAAYTIDGNESITCKENEIYKENGCEPNCGNVLTEPCLGQTVSSSGCFCAAGYLRDENTTECIPVQECSTIVCTEENTELNLSGRFTVCTGPGKSYTGYPFRPQPVCTCKIGFARSSEGCIPVSECK